MKGGVAGDFPPAEGVAYKTTKRRESELLAGAIRGAAWLGSEGKAFPFHNIVTIEVTAKIW